MEMTLKKFINDGMLFNFGFSSFIGNIVVKNDALLNQSKSKNLKVGQQKEILGRLLAYKIFSG